MRHLSADERLALIEAAAPPAHAHLAACPRCREEVAEARDALAALRAEPVPEPSPLFWDQFSRRVSEHLDVEPEPAEGRRPVRAWRWLAPLGAVAVALVMVVAGGGRVRRAVAPQPTPAAGAPAVPAGAGEGIEVQDEAWTVLGDVAGDFDVDALGDSLGRSASGADAAVWELDDHERVELARLLQAELAAARPGS
jgi:hypothetical protein